ncbi:uncharacterized protein LOC141713136 [Apium graveolens]|uniref:uncharacterized protein LOC141713136 n=1 Tax=Apium graveolens TaxID=4045 RepID=UPI003D794DAC
MGKSTTLECMKKFCQQVEGLFGVEYLRAPTPTDLRRLLTRGEQRGFPGMIGSIDCMYWKWKNCPSGWGWGYSGRKGRHTIILEAVASYDTWIWHAFFGVPGAQNDINVVGQSPVFDIVIAGNSPTVVFHVNGKRYNNAYYLTDGIYPRYSTFVYDGPVDSNGVRIPFAPVQRNGTNQQAFWDRIENLESAYIHTMLQNNLVEHNWAIEANQ